MALYKQGRRGISLHIGNEILTQDRNYLLAHQLIAYSSMSLQSRRGAVQELEHLQELHPDYVDVYQFFQAICHYFEGKYAASVSVFQQIPTQSAYFHDALRYLFLSYIALGDTAKAGETATELLQTDDLVIADIYTIFDLFFYTPLKEKSEFTLYAFFPQVVDEALRICESRFTKYGYVCLYGKAGSLIADHEEDKALRLLEGVVKRYPRAELYEYIGDLYRNKDEKTVAQGRYQQAFLLAESFPK
ncbi:MAG: hypothetical protein Q8O99_03055 [bacterium]|nr:hypothetical protein [bacterium]